MFRWPEIIAIGDFIQVSYEDTMRICAMSNVNTCSTQAYSMNRVILVTEITSSQDTVLLNIYACLIQPNQHRLTGHGYTYQ